MTNYTLEEVNKMIADLDRRMAKNYKYLKSLGDSVDSSDCGPMTNMANEMVYLKALRNSLQWMEK